MEKVEEKLRLTDKAEAFVITGKMVEAAAAVIRTHLNMENAEVSEESVRLMASDAIKAAWVARNNP